MASLIILAVFFYAIVHMLGLPYSTELFFILLFLLAISGFFIIRRITQSLTNLASQIELISSSNLDSHIRDIKSKDEIGNLAQSFNNLLDRLSEAFKREEQFIADVAHELKNPLATQRSALEIALSKKRTNEEYRVALNDALTDNNHLSSTLKNVLDLAWSELPNEQKNAKNFNLSELMEDLYEIAVKMATAKNIKIKKSIEKGILISGFKDKLGRAILNIIDNAIKYTSSQGTINLKFEKVKQKIHISINDTGQGIKKDDIPHIFDRFYRGSSVEKVQGSGLGLAISKSILAVHKGKIFVKSKVGKGTQFSLTLPLD